MTQLNLKPTHAPIKLYYETLDKFGRANFDNEGNIRGAFEDLLKKCARQFEWTLIPEYPIASGKKTTLRVDGALIDAFNLPRAWWEAKDTKDSLRAEAEKKFALGYPRTNILFQTPTHALLVQNGRIEFDGQITDPIKLVDALRPFFEYRQPNQENWDRAVREFSERIPEIAQGALKLIDDEHKTNKVFKERFTAFANLCRESINPDLKDSAVEEMLVQHLLTERIFRRIFDNPEFTRRNIIAAEIEKVIDSLTKRHFSRDAFLKELDPFYKAIEEAASTTESYTEKQAFLNKVYERFFQGFSKKQADTHGIVYTPQPIVDFMVKSVEEVLKTEFGRSLSDKGVHILDPFVGTGNFITRIMQEIKTSALPHKYKEELHCNEVMLLPYYIASMNIEHAYLDKVGEYEPFEGICLVDTFELAEPEQAGFEFMTEGNTERIRRQKKAPIFVVIGNPPYNAGQGNEHDQNKNRKHKNLDSRVRETYTHASNATLLSKLSDPYVKAFRLASDRISPGGIIAFVSNNSFIDERAFDGMRKYLIKEFEKIYVLNLGGNVHKNPQLSGTTHNVFGIQVGVAITLLIKKANQTKPKGSQLLYSSVGPDWRKEQKYLQLNSWGDVSAIQWEELKPDTKNTWLTQGQHDEFATFPSMSAAEGATMSIFAARSLGVSTNRDQIAYSFDRAKLTDKVKNFIQSYNSEVDRYVREHKPKNLDDFVNYDSLKWSRNLKRHLGDCQYAEFDAARVVPCLYRAFNRRFLYLSDIVVDEPARSGSFVGEGNLIIGVTAPASDKPFLALAATGAVDLHMSSPGCGTHCFPFYTYTHDEDGTNRHENITDWSLAEFRTYYGQQAISKWDIFHYTYALLHHPEYRTRYAANLKRELPRTPYAPAFTEYARIGQRLMDIHIHYEQQPVYKLDSEETGKLNWRVEKMKLNKDRTELRYNDFLTLTGIPPEVYEYKLGNRSALEWVIDQYQVSTDKRSGITNDPNREDDPQYIVRLIGQVISVSLETVRLVRELAALPIR